MPQPIENQVALVTGANRGIGKSIVEALIAAGAAKVYAAVRNTDSAQPLVEQFGDKVVPVELDLQKADTVKAAAEVATDVQIVINNAGVLTSTSALADDALDQLTFELDVNVYGLIRVAQAFAPVLKANGGGALVQLNSVVSLKTFTAFTTYGASKAASFGVTQGLRDDLAEQGTSIVSVHPGPIATEMLDGSGFEEMATPPSVVADAIIDGLRNDTYLVFPDPMAKDFGQAYDSFAKSMIEPVMTEA